MALDFAAGCLGGCAGVLVGHPLDTVKVHLQTQCPVNPTYRGTFHCLKTIIIKDSVRGLYRGMSSPMAGVAFVNAIIFGVYGNVQRRTENPNSLYSHFLAGATAGLAQSIIGSPMELVKTRLQLQANSEVCVKLKGPIHCLNYIWKVEGIRGVFKGLGITVIRDVPGFAAYFVAYEIMTRKNKASALYTLVAGGLAGMFSWLLTFPPDVIKSRLQSDGMFGKPKYNGIVDCIQKSYKEEGLRFLSRGLLSTLIRAFPVNAACFYVVSLVLKLCNESNLEVDIGKPESFHVVGSISAPLMIPVTYPDHKKIKVNHTHTVKSLLFLGAFSEAVCASEIIELASEVYDNNHENYYHYELNNNNNNTDNNINNLSVKSKTIK